MSFARAVKRRAQAVLPATIFLALAGYFGWQATRGTLGLRAYAARQQDLAQAETALTGAEAEQAAWRNRVTGLQGDHLDLDALDERARQMLNLSAPQDIIIPMKTP